MNNLNFCRSRITSGSSICRLRKNARELRVVLFGTKRGLQPEIALRNCSKEVGEKVSIYMILVMGKYMQSSSDSLFTESFC